MTAKRIAGCPCLSGLPYDECCGPLHRGESLAPTAERLMRSRYSAFVVGDSAYLLATWHPVGRPATLEIDGERRWLGLEILARQRGGMLDTAGTVEYRARYSSRGVRGEQHEVGAFVREGRRWLYVGASS
jgi:SEC-C motif-containing protein